MESALPPLVVREMALLAWDDRGTLGDLMNRMPVMRTPIENLADSLDREWSRLTDDYSEIEARYSLNLGQAIPEIFPTEGAGEIPDWFGRGSLPGRAGDSERVGCVRAWSAARGWEAGSPPGYDGDLRPTWSDHGPSG